MIGLLLIVASTPPFDNRSATSPRRLAIDVTLQFVAEQSA
jgi:hypothetical protein